MKSISKLYAFENIRNLPAILSRTKCVNLQKNQLLGNHTCLPAPNCYGFYVIHKELLVILQSLTH